jgi:serine/threonine protein kinase
MSGGTGFDEDLVRRLPLPLAQLYRRAYNAKTALDRYLTAFYLWEASLKLLASVAIVEHAEQVETDPQLADRLSNLARPSLGHWWEFARRLVPLLADRGDASFQKMRELLLGRSRDDLPRATGLDATLREILEGKSGARAIVRLTELFDRLLQLRNAEMGHGAAGQRRGDFYERLGPVLLAGVAEILGRLDVLAGRRLVHVADVRRQSSGNWLVERYELIGEGVRRLESLDVAAADASGLPLPGRLYLQEAEAAGPGTAPWRALHPLVVFDADTARAFFLNARRGERQADYLCYTTGEGLKRAELGPEQRELLARVLHAPVDESALAVLSAHSQAEEAPVAAPEPSDPARRNIGEFELISRIGRGAMGVVYRAWQPSLRRQVALKCLLRSGDPKAEERFARETRALGKVEHSNLVKVFTSGAEGDQWFYAMELIEGADLAAVCTRVAGSTVSDLNEDDWTRALSNACEEQWQQEKPLSDHDASFVRASTAKATPPAPAVTHKTGRSHVARVVEIVRQTAEAAHALHEGGIVHRDIKPGNIMVTADGRHAVLMDLGLAQLLDETEGRLTRTRQFLGTLRYASPEQILAAGRLDRRADVYSLGATLWELLTLRPLYGQNEQMPDMELMLRIQTAEPDRPRRHNPHVSEDLEAIVLKCLEKDRARRYGSANELAQDLERWQRGDPVSAQPPTLWYFLGKYVRKNRLRIAISVATLVALIGAVAFEFYRVDADRREAIQSRLVAISSKNEANQEKERAEAALKEAEQQRKRAEDNFRQTRQAIDRYFTVISESQLTDVAGSAPLRRELLKAALEFYQKFPKVESDDPEVQAELAAAYFRMAQIQNTTRDGDWLSTVEKAHEIVERLLASGTPIEKLKSLESGVTDVAGQTFNLDPSSFQKAGLREVVWVTFRALAGWR